MSRAMADCRVLVAAAVILVIWQVRRCSSVERPKLLLLEGGTRCGGGFCPGETAQLKCIFPEGELASVWYVSGYTRPIDAEYLSVDLPGHSAELVPERNYTIVSIFKEKPYRANYSCAVDRFAQLDVLSNSVEVVFRALEESTAVTTRSGHLAYSIGTCSASGTLLVAVLALLVVAVLILKFKKRRLDPNAYDKASPHYEVPNREGGGNEARAEDTTEPQRLQHNPAYCYIETMKETPMSYANVTL